MLKAGTPRLVLQRNTPCGLELHGVFVIVALCYFTLTALVALQAE